MGQLGLNRLREWSLSSLENGVFRPRSVAFAQLGRAHTAARKAGNSSCDLVGLVDVLPSEEPNRRKFASTLRWRTARSSGGRTAFNWSEASNWQRRYLKLFLCLSMSFLKPREKRSESLRKQPLSAVYQPSGKFELNSIKGVSRS